jgi:phage N-6-adenine-methyltransferase
MVIHMIQIVSVIAIIRLNKKIKIGLGIRIFRFRGFQDHMNLKDEFETPQWFYDLVNQDYRFVVDICASRENAKSPVYISKEVDALKLDWAHDVAKGQKIAFWMNPPYSDPGPWVEKAYRESLKGLTIVALLPGDFSTKWWHDWVSKAYSIYLIKGRLKFSGQGPARFPNALVVFQPHRVIPGGIGSADLDMGDWEPWVKHWDPRAEYAERIKEQMEDGRVESYTHNTK